MDREILILAGAAVGLFGWQSMPSWRQALRLAPVFALLLSALTAIVSVQLPSFISPVLIGMGVTVATLQLTKSGGGGSARRRR